MENKKRRQPTKEADRAFSLGCNLKRIIRQLADNPPLQMTTPHHF